MQKDMLELKDGINMKKFLVGAAAVLGLASVAAPANADSVAATVRFVDSDKGNAGQYVLDYEHSMEYLRPGIELSRTESSHASTSLSGHLGVDIAGPFGSVFSPLGELGYTWHEQGDNAAFWGASLTWSKQVGPFTLDTSFRHRNEFGHTTTEDRFGVGGSVKIGTNQSLGLHFYTINSAVDSNVVGLTYKFSL